MGTVYINGKFTAQRITGVQRVALNLLRALDRRLAAEGGVAAERWALLVPPGACAPALRCVQVVPVGAAAHALHLWEQWQLPRAARDGLLVNLSGSAPAHAAAQVCLLHDAAVFDRPAAYTLPFRLWYRFLFRRLARHARLLLTVSAFARGRLAVALGVGEARLMVLPNGADHLAAVSADETVLDAHGLRGRAFLLAVGGANPNKNGAGLLAAWRRLGADRGDALLVVCGADDPRVFAQRSAADEPLPGLVRLGRVDDARLKALYGHAHGLVFPSLYEGFGLPPLEAMACGCPVAASDAASLPEVCGGAALLFDARSPAAIAAAMRTLLEDGGRREELRARGLARARQFTWDAAAARLLAELRALQADPAP